MPPRQWFYAPLGLRPSRSTWSSICAPIDRLTVRLTCRSIGAYGHLMNSRRRASSISGHSQGLNIRGGGDEIFGSSSISHHPQYITRSNRQVGNQVSLHLAVPRLTKPDSVTTEKNPRPQTQYPTARHVLARPRQPFHVSIRCQASNGDGGRAAQEHRHRNQGVTLPVRAQVSRRTG